MSQPQRQQHSQGEIVRRPSAEIVGSFTKPEAITERLVAASTQCHLISPTTSVGRLPEGFEVSISMVVLDVENETYNQQGKRALSKVALDKIAAAAGVSWDPVQSARVDDGSNPDYCMFRAVGVVKDFDGTRRVLSKTKEMDLREGSGAYDDIFASAETETKAWTQLRSMRKHIVAHAESKAQCRVMRALGVRSTYTREEIAKPFAVARLMFTGRTEDPELRAVFAKMIAEDALGGAKLLYGGAPAQVAAPAPRLMAPPPLGASNEEEEDDLPEPIAARQPAQTQQRQPAREERGDAPGERKPSGFVIPGGREKDTPIERASDESITYWRNRIAGSLDRGESRFEKKDRELVAALSAEMAHRAGGDDRFDDEELPEHLR